MTSAIDHLGNLLTGDSLHQAIAQDYQQLHGNN